MATEMPHKFKIGTAVYYHSKDRMLNTVRGTYTITGLMPGLEGQQAEYRIRHFSEDFEGVAFENELGGGVKRGVFVRELIYTFPFWPDFAAAWPLLSTADCLPFSLLPLQLSQPMSPSASEADAPRHNV